MKRIVLKISGEALSGDTGVGINYNKVKDIANEIKDLHDSGDIELSIVVGAGNICRGREAIATGMNRTNADYMGMLATVINAMALQGALEGLGKEAVVMTALSMPIVTQFYTRRDCLEQLSIIDNILINKTTTNIKSAPVSNFAPKSLTVFVFLATIPSITSVNPQSMYVIKN